MIRQDAWNQDEDLLLAETVLKHIREGGTQLAAFEEVAEKLSRTSAACGFRWNSSIRKKYDSAIQLAKKVRKESKKTKVQSEENIRRAESEEGFNSTRNSKQQEQDWYDQMILFLKNEREKLDCNKEEAHVRVAKLSEENQTLKQELATIKDNYQDVKEEYQLMIHAMQRATKKERLEK